MAAPIRGARNRTLAAAAMFLVAAPLTVVACNIIAGIEEPELRPPTPPLPDTASTTTEVDVPPSDAGCPLARWPAPPTKDDPSDGGNVTFVVALRKLSFRIDPIAPPGYDLDGVCTCPQEESCVRPEAGKQQCDEKEGRDLAMNKELFTFLESSKGFGQESLDKGLETGSFGGLIRVSRWNGTPNDVQVDVELFLSSGVPRNDAGLPPEGGLQWDGGDKWDLEPVGLVSDAGPITSKYLDASAYVRDGVLVASKLEGARFLLGEGQNQADLQFAQTILTAKLGRLGNSHILESGVMAARWPTVNLLNGVKTLMDPVANVPMCKSTIFYPTLKKQVCASADIASSIARDRTNFPCDSVSMGFTFSADPAKFGMLRPKRVDPDAAAACVGFADDCTKP